MLFPPLDEHDLGPDPIQVFRAWYDAAASAGVPQHDAMALATASADGAPSARMVLLKEADERGFVFYTNYASRKGRDLAANPRAALVFFWPGHDRSVRVEGTVARLLGEESDAYFAARPRDGQLSSLASAQSEPVAGREALDRRFDELRRQYETEPIPRPAGWGGYRLTPVRIEFWQARFARLNDRVEYRRREDGSWEKRRLAP